MANSINFDSLDNLDNDFDRIYPQQRMTRPHVETNYNDDALMGQSTDSDKAVAIIGSAENGRPNTVYKLNNYMDAKTIFGGGDILEAVQLLWSPQGKNVGSSGTVYAMRVEDATPAILNAGGLRFTSKAYGELANNITLALEQNSLDNSYKLTVDFPNYDYHAIYDGLGQLFRLQYNRNSKDAKADYSVKVNPKTGKATNFIIDIWDTPASETTTTLAPTTTTSTMFLNTTTTTETTLFPSRTTTTTNDTTTTTVNPDGSTTTTTTKIAINNVLFDTNEAEVKTGDELQLSWKIDPADATQSSLKFDTDNTDVATVDAQGRVKTFKEGIANISVSVTDANGKVVGDSLKLTVSNNATGDTAGVNNLKRNFVSDPINLQFFAETTTTTTTTKDGTTTTSSTTTTTFITEGVQIEATPGDGQVHIKLTPGKYDADNGVTGYNLYYKTRSDNWPAKANLTLDAKSLETDIKGLVNDSEYTFGVTTVTKDGEVGNIASSAVSTHATPVAATTTTTTTVAPETTTSTTTVNPDGTTTTTTVNPDGTTTTTTEDPSGTTSTSTTTVVNPDGSTTTTTTDAQDHGDGTVSTTTTVSTLRHLQQDFDLSRKDNQELYSLMNELSLIPNLTIYSAPQTDNTGVSSDILDAAEHINIVYPQGSLQPTTTSTTSTTKDEHVVVEGSTTTHRTADAGSVVNDTDASTTTTTNAVPSTTIQPAEDEELIGWVWGVRGDIESKLAYDQYVSVTANYLEEFTQPFGSTHMINGTTSQPPISWADKFQNFNQVPAYFLVPLTSSANVHQELKAYINDRFNAGTFLRGFVGAGMSETTGQLVARQTRLKEPRICLIGTSGYFTMPDNSVVHLPAYMVAVVAAAVASSLQIGGALTNKYINMVSVDQQFTSTELDTLNGSGIILVEPILNRGTASGFRFIQDVTTYNDPKEKVKSRESMGEITDFLFDDMRQYLENNWIGKNIRKNSAGLLRNAIDSYLYKIALDPDGYIVDYDSNDIEVYLKGDQAWIEFTVMPSQTLDFIKVYGAYANFTDYSGGTNTYTSANSSTSNSSQEVLYGSSKNDIYGVPTTDSSNTDITKSQNPDINAGYGF